MPYKNPSDRKKWERDRSLEFREAARAYKEKTPCKDCRNTFPHYVMEFDHVPERGLKVNTVSQMCNGNTSPQKLEAEIAKCDLVCANCHKVRTWHRKQQSGL